MIFDGKNLKKTYLHYLFAGIGSAVIVSIYSIVDAIMVGQYEGYNGTAALSVVMPIWTIILSLGLLFGVGGGSLMSKARGEGNERRGREFFTCALVCVSVVALAVWALLIFCETPLLRLFGADDTLLPLAKGYLKWMKFSMPLFTMGQFLACFIRNDNAPAKAMAAVITGGVFNIGGDYFFVFVCDMGVEGAGLATALGQVLAILILCSHFFSKKNGLKTVRFSAFFKKASAIFVAGFSVFVVDIAMGILAMLFNNQIMKYLDTSSLAVYGVIVNLSSLVQSLSYGGTGCAADRLQSLRRGPNRGYPPRAKIRHRFCVCRGIARVGGGGGLSLRNHQGLYENRFRRREHRAADSADLRPVLCIASPQYLFHLFLSGDYEARRRADDFPCAGNLRERPAHFHFTADFRRGSIVVGDARYRTSHVCPRPAAR